MTGILQGKTALVTGGAGGIGRAISLNLSKAGARLIILGRDRTKGDEVVAEIESAGGRARFLPTDLSDMDMMESAVSELAEEEPIEILVNNAGISGYTGPVLETPISELNSVLQVNAVAPFLLSRLLLPGMMKLGSGRIINISSVASRVNPPNSTGYNMSKAALNSFTSSLSREVAAGGITVNAIAPGLVLTDRIRNSRIPQLAEASGRSPDEVLAGMTSGTDTGRLTTKEELAEAVRFLCSEGARNITGEIIEMSGGY